MLSETTSQLINRRYHILEKLGAGGMGAVFRVQDRLSGQTVALKRVLTELEHAGTTGSSDSSDFRVALSREFRTLATLRHPNIISVLDYGFDNEQMPYFTMSLVEGTQTLRDASQDKPLQTYIRYILEMLEALSYLHQRGILHRDLKPGNVLVDHHDTVKMLDFGLSTASSLSMSNMESGTVGTLAYMAPELFTEEESSIATDLYAAGVVAYEILTGNRPFQSKNMALLINSILNMSADYSLIDDRLVPVIDTLLSKKPEDRYNSARETIKAFCEAMNYPVPKETIAIRESFLQTAKLIGRDEELRTLRQALNEAIEGHGKSFLIAGESGVGKSRLLDEIRIRAMVKGLIVLRGTAVSEGGSTYQLWRNVLHSLLIHIDLTDEQAGVLKSLVPDISRLLDREIDEAEPLKDPAQAQARLFNTVRDILRDQRLPLLILLEDLQWAGSDSLALLNHFNQLALDLPLMIVATFRDDEQAQDIAGAMEIISLNRLTDSDIAQLAKEMLGEAGQSRDVIQLLQRESEGNAFFLVEITRTLATELDSLHDIGSVPLPDKVISGGITAILDRRIGQIPSDLRGLLRYAAIAGKQIDTALLAHLAPDTNIENWLAICSNANVLEVQDEQWFFAHNKLRDRLIDALSSDEKKTAYRRVAETIESVYPDNEAHVATLAHLWHVAEDLEKERHYASLAGFQAMSVTANAVAIEHFERVLELLKDQPETGDRINEELDVQMALGVALQQTRGYSPVEVEQAWERSIELCDKLDQPPQLIGALFGLCGVHMIRGEHEKSAGMDTQIFELADVSEHPNVVRAQASYTKLVNLLAMGEIDNALECARQVTQYYDPADAQYAIKMYGSIPTITAQAWIACILQIQGYSEQASAMFEQALTTAREMNHPYTLSNVLAFSWVKQLAGDVDGAMAISAENIELATEYGFNFQQLFTLPVLGWALAHRHQSEEGVLRIRQAVDMMYMFGAVMLRNYFLGMLAEAHIALGQEDEAHTIIDEALERIESSVDRFYEPEIYRIKAELLWRLQGDEDGAENYFIKAMDISQQRGANWFLLRSSYCLARLWQSQGKNDRAKETLSTVYDLFTEGFDTGDLIEAKTLLDSL